MRQEISYSLAHLRRMTDGTSMLQHAIGSVPNYAEGYDTDDDARALIAAVQLEALGGSGQSALPETPDLAARYLAYLCYAFNSASGRFRNFMGYDRRWLDDAGSEDSHARALWALGSVLGYSRRADLCRVATDLFKAALPAVADFAHPHPWAFALLGLDPYLHACPQDSTAQRLRTELATRLLEARRATAGHEWQWFTDALTYDNATMARALLLAGHATERPELVQVALTALGWLVKIQRPDDGYFVPIGNRGFYQRGGVRARFDQQPIEAYATVAACLDAFRVTGEDRWQAEANVAFEWFLGANDRHTCMYDPQTGGCCDGLEAERINPNQGAESTLAYLLSALAWQLTGRKVSATTHN